MRVARTYSGQLHAKHGQFDENTATRIRDLLQDEVDRLLSLIVRYPRMGEAVDHLGPGVRRHTLGDYLLFYRLSGDGIEVIRVLHGARDIDRLF